MFYYGFLASFAMFQFLSPTHYKSNTSSFNNRAPANAGEISLFKDDKSSADKLDPEKLCTNESEGEKLKKEAQKHLEDKEAILKQLADLKKENLELKDKINPTVPKKEKKEVEAGELISLMSQMTSLFSAQMENQMQSQMLIFGLLNQSQNAFAPLSNRHSMNFSQRFSMRGIPSFNDQMDLGEWNVGIPAYQAQYSSPQNYLNPFENEFSLIRQPLPEYGSSFGGIQPARKGFDFNQKVNSGTIQI